MSSQGEESLDGAGGSPCHSTYWAGSILAVEFTVLTRQELFDLVWTTPMQTLARRYGITDVALKKRCKKHGIPTPGVGYWARVTAGQKLK